VRDTRSHEKTTRLVNVFVERFKSLNGSIVCRELLDCDLSTEQGQRAFVDKKLRDKLCTKFVRDAATIVKDLLV
jgi:hypothetical protein